MAWRYPHLNAAHTPIVGRSSAAPMAAAVLILAALLQAAAGAGWDGLPLADETSAWTWQTKNLRAQLYEAAAERGAIYGSAGPTIIETWTVPDGAGTRSHLTTNLTAASFITTYGDTTATNYPIITSTFVSTLWTYLNGVVSAGWVCPAEADETGLYTTYLAQTDGDGAVPDELPALSIAEIFTREDIGFATNITTNAWGYITGGTWEFTRHTAATGNVVLAVLAADTAWTFQNVQPFQRHNWDPNVRPVIKYELAGEAAIGTLSVTITGDAQRPDGLLEEDAEETVDVTDSTTALATNWIVITGMTCADPPPNYGDSMALAYVAAYETHATPSSAGGAGYYIQPATVDELFAVMTNMVWSLHEDVVGDSATNGAYFRVRGGDGSDAVYATAVAEQAADWTFNTWNYNADEDILYEAAASVKKPATPYNLDATRYKYRVHGDVDYTDLECSIDVYFREDPYHIPDFANIDSLTGLADNGVMFFETLAASDAATRTGAWLGDLGNAYTTSGLGAGDVPADIAARLDRMDWVLKWDNANGLEYQ